MLYRQPWALHSQAEQGARMKHQAITAALIPPSYAVMQSQGLTEYKKNKTDVDCCEVSNQCLKQITASTDMLNGCYATDLVTATFSLSCLVTSG